jgi:hypothetical protein
VHTGGRDILLIRTIRDPLPRFAVEATDEVVASLENMNE